MTLSTHWTDDDVRQGELSSRIVPVRRRDDAERAALITDVVDAFARLRGSLLRFVALFAEGAANGAAQPVPAHDTRRFDVLLATLAVGAERARFGRLAELRRLMERVARAETHRDVIFAPCPSAGPAALREATLSLERLDAELVGLCVEHVLESRTRPAANVGAATAPGTGARRAARRTASSSPASRDVCAETDVSVDTAGSVL